MKNDILKYIIHPQGITGTLDLRDNAEIEFPFNTISVTIGIDLDQTFEQNRAWKPVTIDGVDVSSDYPYFRPNNYVWEYTSTIPTDPIFSDVVIQTYSSSNANTAKNDMWSDINQPTYQGIKLKLKIAPSDIILGSNSGVVISSGSEDSSTGLTDSSKSNSVFSGLVADSGRFNDLYADSAYFKYLRADSADIKWLRADSVDIISLRADSGYIKQLTSDSGYFKYLRADSGYISQFRSDSAKISFLNVPKLSGDSASIQSELRVGRYVFDAGEWDSNDLLTDINALAKDDFGGIYYTQPDSISGIREKFAHVKYDQIDRKWQFFPNLNISDLDSSGVVDSENAVSKSSNMPFGEGENGQFLFYDKFQKKYDWDYIVTSGKFVFDSDQLSNALKNIPADLGSDSDKAESLKQYFDYKFYSHGDEKFIESGGNLILVQSNIDNLNSFNNHDKIKSARVNNQNTYVYLDSNNHTFNTTNLDSDRLNITSKIQKINKSINGVYSNSPSQSYTLQATFSAVDSEKQTGAMGILVGLIKSGLDEKTLTVLRSTRQDGMFDSDIDMVKTRDDYPFNFELVYNAGQADETVINMGRIVEAPPINTDASWDSSGHVVIKVQKRDYSLVIETSQFGDSSIDPLTTKRIDLYDNLGIPSEVDYLDLREFGNPVHYGFAFDKISNATVKDILFSEGVEGLNQTDANTVVDLQNKTAYIYFDSDKALDFGVSKGYHQTDSDGFGGPIVGGDIITGRLYHNPELGATWYQDPYSTFQIGQVQSKAQQKLLDGVKLFIAGGYDGDKRRTIEKDDLGLEGIDNSFIKNEKGITLTVFTDIGDLVSTTNYDIDATVDTSGVVAQQMATDLTALRNGGTNNICVITSFGNWKYTDSFLIAELKEHGLVKLSAAGTAAIGNYQYAAIFQLGSKSKVYEVAEFADSINQAMIRVFILNKTFFLIGGETNSNSALTNFRGTIIAETTGANDLKLSGGVIATTPSTFNSTVNVAAGATNGIHFPDEAFASDADDQARIYLIDSPNASGNQILTIEVKNDNTDLINLSTPESDGNGKGMKGLRHNMKSIFSEGYLDISYDDSPSLGGNLNIKEYKIFSKPSDDEWEGDKPTFEFDYDEAADDTNSTLLSSYNSIYNFLDITNNSTGKYFGIWNNKNPYSDTVNSGNSIFRVDENGDVNVTGVFNTVTTDGLTEGSTNLYHRDSRAIIAVQNKISVTTVSAAGGGALSWTPSPDAVQDGILNFTPALSHSVTTSDPDGSTSTLAYDASTGAFTFKSAKISDIVDSTLENISVANATPSGNASSLAYNSGTGIITLTPADIPTTAKTSISVTNDASNREAGGEISYAEGTGVITFKKDYLLSVTNATPSGTGSLAYNGTGSFTFTPPSAGNGLTVTTSAAQSRVPAALSHSNGTFTFRPAELFPPISIIDTPSIPSHGEGSLGYDSATGVLTHLRAATVNLLNFRGTTDSDNAEFGKVGTISFSSDSNYGIGTFKLTPGYFATNIDSCLDTTLTIPHAGETMGQVSAAVVATKPSVMMLDSSAAIKFSNRRISLGDLVNVADSANAALGFVLTKTHQGYADATPHGSNFEFKALPSSIGLTDLSVTGLTSADDVNGNIVYDNTNGEFSFKPPFFIGRVTGGNGGTTTPDAHNGIVTFAADGSSGLTVSASGQTVTIDASSVGGFSVDNNANNRIVTATGSGGNAEANATFDGSTLAIAGAITATGNISAEGNVIAAASSDLRLKDNLEKIDNALEKVSRLNGYTFTWNEKADKIFSSKNDVGVVAQEVEEVLPEIVIDRADGYKAVYYEKLVPLLIESIKELKERIEELEKR